MASTGGPTAVTAWTQVLVRLSRGSWWSSERESGQRRSGDSLGDLSVIASLEFLGAMGSMGSLEGRARAAGWAVWAVWAPVGYVWYVKAVT